MTALETGFAALLTMHGEDLTYRGGTIRAIVNRTPDRSTAGNSYDFDLRDASIIQFIHDPDNPPAVGEYLVDTNSIRHRIMRAKRLTYFAECTCTVE